MHSQRGEPSNTIIIGRDERFVPDINKKRPASFVPMDRGALIEERFLEVRITYLGTQPSYATYWSRKFRTHFEEAC